MRELRLGKSIMIGDTAIVSLEEVASHCRSDRGMFAACASKGPAAIVIASPQGKWAADMDGKRVPLETYIQGVEGLQQVLDGL
jgi:hypothetical protein